MKQRRFYYGVGTTLSVLFTMANNCPLWSSVPSSVEWESFIMTSLLPGRLRRAKEEKALGEAEGLGAWHAGGTQTVCGR